MELNLSVCEYSWEAVVCKVALTEDQIDKVNNVLRDNQTDMFEYDAELDDPVSEIEIRGVNCISFIEEDQLIMSIRMNDALMMEINGFDIFKEKELYKQVLNETWMLFVPHIKKFF